MTGDEGASHSVPLHTSTRPILIGFAAPGHAAGRSMKPGKELAPAGGSSADAVGSPPTQRKCVKGGKGEAEGGERKKMTGGDGASHSVPLAASTTLIHSVSAAPGRAAGRSMKPGKEFAPAGGFSADTVGSPPTARKSVKRREGETERGKRKKMKKAVQDPLREGYWCSICWRLFANKNKANGRTQIHTKRGEEVELSTADVQKRKIHMKLDLNKEPPEE